MIVIYDDKRNVVVWGNYQFISFQNELKTGTQIVYLSKNNLHYYPICAFLSFLFVIIFVFLETNNSTCSDRQKRQ